MFNQKQDKVKQPEQEVFESLFGIFVVPFVKIGLIVGSVLTFLAGGVGYFIYRMVIK